MSIRLSIRPAEIGALQTLVRLRREWWLHHAMDSAAPATDFPSREDEVLRERVLDGCVLIAWARGQIVAMNALDLDEAAMVDTLVAPPWQRRGLGRRMVAALEQLAVRFGLTRLAATARAPTEAFYLACGYRPAGAAGPGCVHLRRDFPQRQTRYGARIVRVLDSIGIDRDYGRRHRMPLQDECRELATIGRDIHGREQMLAPAAARAWYDMRNTAQEDGIRLEVASAYRSVGYQVSIIERKKLAGQELADILRVSAAPGYSEHHTGRALDLSTPGSEPLETGFERTEAFEWLVGNADRHGFRMSFPRNNRHGIAYEPWHWLFIKE